MKNLYAKFMKMILWWLLVIPAFVIAEEPTLEEFAQGYELITDGSGAIYRVTLPQSIYRIIVRQDLGDIRVFNHAGQRVPHAIRQPDTQTVARTARLEIPFFPLPEKTIEFPAEDVDIQIADDGRIINIQYRGKQHPQDQAETHRYILDLSSVHQNIDELEFELTKNTGNYLKRVMLEGSDDLNSWNTLVRNVTLSKLDYAGHTLEKNVIQLNNASNKYLRFTWQEDPDGLQLQGIHARLNSISRERQKLHTTVTGKRSEKDKHIIEFDTSGAFPIDEFNIHFPEDNTLIEAMVKSRNDDKANWHSHYSGLFYKLNMKGTTLEQGPVHIRTTTDRYWQLQMKEEDGIGNTMPELEFVWVPNELYFLARGEGPFTLAFGNAEAGAPGKPIDSLMRVLSADQESELIQQAALGNQLSFKGSAALQPERKIPWQRILLWGVLIVGVLIIAIMAIRLSRQINHSE